MSNPLAIDYRMDSDFKLKVSILKTPGGQIESVADSTTGLPFDLTSATITLYIRDRANRKDDEVDAEGGKMKVLSVQAGNELIRSIVEVAVDNGDIPDGSAPGIASDLSAKFFWDMHVVESGGNDFYFPTKPQPFRIFGGGSS